MGKKTDESQKQQRVQSVLEILKKQSPLTIKQIKCRGSMHAGAWITVASPVVRMATATAAQQTENCNNRCVERFLKAKGDSVKKTAKMMRACLAWRDSIGTDTLMADDFSSEIAEGVAHVAGHDDESRPVVVFRIKQDYHKFHSHKSFTKLLVFTLEVAIQTMPKTVDQIVLLFDASFYTSASAFMNMLLTTLKIMADYYPTRLYKAFVIHPPSIFTYLWKGVKPFVELSPVTAVVSSLDYVGSFEYDDMRASSSLRFDSAKVGHCSSSRFSFTVSHHFDTVKPWYLSLTDMPATAKVGPSRADVRSYSFASPRADFVRKSFFPSTPMPEKTQKVDTTKVRHPMTPKASFLQSPAVFFRREAQGGRGEKSRESFVPLLKFYRRPYDEMIYRVGIPSHVRD